MSLHYRNIQEIPKNIFSIYDLDEYYEEWWFDDFDDDFFEFFEDITFVITNSRVYETDSYSYYEELISDDETFQYILSKDYVIYGDKEKIKKRLVEKYPECFV